MIIWNAVIKPSLSGSKINHAMLPAGAKPLSVGLIGKQIVVWAEVDPIQPLTDTPFVVIPVNVKPRPGDGTELADRFLGRVDVPSEREEGKILNLHVFTSR